MFRIEYKIIDREYDYFKGQNGFFIIYINEKEFGEMYEESLVDVFGTEDISVKLKNLIHIIDLLKTKNYVVWSDIQSYNLWIEFIKNKDKVTISLKRADKLEGSREIEEELINGEDGFWVDENVSYKQMYDEIISKSNKYLEYLEKNNQTDKNYLDFKQTLQKIMA